MKEMYFDIEVAYLKEEDSEKIMAGKRGPPPLPKHCKIITMQYRFLTPEGKPDGELHVFKEWESSEEQLLKKAYALINPHTQWEVIPVGQNIMFDLGFLKGRGEQYGIRYPEWWLYHDLPVIDIKAILLGMNGFRFKDSGLDKFTGKESSGLNVPVWYAQKEWEKILAYIQKETAEFISFYQKLKRLLPEFRKLHGFE